MSEPIGFVERRSCPACGSKDYARVYRAPFRAPLWKNFLSDYYREPIDLAGDYIIDRCEDCGTMFQRQVGNEALLNRLYGEWIKTGEPEDDPGFRFDVGHPEQARDGHEIMAAASYIGVPLNEMVTLDYGAGWAGWARIARSLGCKSHSFDLASNRQSMAEVNGILPDNARYHFINTEQVMEHLTEPAVVAQQLTAKLLPGGLLKISVPSNRGVAKTLARLRSGQTKVSRDEIMPVQPLEHVNCFTRRGLRALGKRFGLAESIPAYRHRYAFLRHRYTLDLGDPIRTAKELVRPFWQWRNPANLYLWLQKA